VGAALSVGSTGLSVVSSGGVLSVGTASDVGAGVVSAVGTVGAVVVPGVVAVAGAEVPGSCVDGTLCRLVPAGAVGVLAASDGSGGLTKRYSVPISTKATASSTVESRA
jgi:hypothetical protein